MNTNHGFAVEDYKSVNRESILKSDAKIVPAFQNVNDIFSFLLFFITCLTVSVGGLTRFANMTDWMKKVGRSIITNN